MFPFFAILGQDAMRRALTLCAVNRRIGGVLIAGSKGAAKSSAVRAFGEVIGQKIVNVPLNATVDAVTDALDSEKTIFTGKPVMRKGLLTQAKDAILYLDEVNLAGKEITAAILEAAANQPDFMLVGTMNPEEGGLRPQLLDRFGLFAGVQTVKDADIRAAVLKNHAEYETDREGFNARYKNEGARLRSRISAARAVLDSVGVRHKSLESIAELCLKAQAGGHRADIVMRETAIAIAALDGRTLVLDADIEEAASFALPHRANEQNKHNEQKNKHEHNDTNHEQEREQNHKHEHQNQSQSQNHNEDVPQNEGGEASGDNSSTPKTGKEREQVFFAKKDFNAAALAKIVAHKGNREKRTGEGKRTAGKSAGAEGRYLFARAWRQQGGIAFDATIRAAAPYQKSRCREKNGRTLVIKKEDIRAKERQARQSNLLIFAMDSSGSLGAQRRMSECKGVVLSLLKDAYLKRDSVALIIFRGEKSALVLPPTRSAARAHRLLLELPTGGRTPLNDALRRSVVLIKTALRKSKSVLPVLILITDGRGNVPLRQGANPAEELLEIGAVLGKNRAIKTVVIDIEKENMMRLGLAKKFAERAGASYFKVDEFQQESIFNITRSQI